MSFMDDWSPEERDRYQQFMARIDAVVEERLADYRRRGVYVYDMFIHPEDDSDGEPNLWLACDHYTGEEIQTVKRERLAILLGGACRLDRLPGDCSTTSRRNCQTSSRHPHKREQCATLPMCGQPSAPTLRVSP